MQDRLIITKGAKKGKTNMQQENINYTQKDIKAMVPGTFDPITAGHIDVIRRASKLFGEVIVAVAESPRKGAGPMFSLDERVQIARDALSEISNVTVKSFTGLLVDFAAQNDVRVLVKGLRAVTDFEAEFQMSALNYTLSPDLETIFIMALPQNMYLSSSVVRDIAYCKGNVAGLVPKSAGEALARVTGCSFE